MVSGAQGREADYFERLSFMVHSRRKVNDELKHAETSSATSLVRRSSCAQWTGPMSFRAELPDDSEQDFLYLNRRPRRRMVDRHIEDKSVGEAGTRQDDGRQGSLCLIVMDSTPAKDRQAKTGADCRLRACHSFNFAHDVHLSSEYQRLPFKKNADSVAAGGHDQPHAEHVLHRHLGIGRKLPERADQIKRFIEEGHGGRFGDTVQGDREIVDTRIAGEAAMAEPLSVTLHATRRAGEMLGKRVLVTGCGPIGTLSILAARRAQKALGFARAVGADRTINLSEASDGLVAYSQNKGYFDVLYECSGAAPALVAGIGALRPRGVVVQLGLGGDMSIPMMAITAKELDLRGSFRFHEEFAVAVKLMQGGLIDVKPLITHTLPLSDGLRAFEIASDKGQSMKAQIDFS